MDVEQEVEVNTSDSCIRTHLVELCAEAVEHCGSDWTQVQAYLKERIDQLPASDKKALTDEMDSILRFRAPEKPRLIH